MKTIQFKIKDIHFQIGPYLHWFWKSYDRYKDFPTIVNVYGGGPFFQYEYYETYNPNKHGELSPQGYN